MSWSSTASKLPEVYIHVKFRRLFRIFLNHIDICTIIYNYRLLKQMSAGIQNRIVQCILSLESSGMITTRERAPGAQAKPGRAGV